MRNVITAALLMFFSITDIVSAAEDDIFEVETEGSYRMDADTPIQMAQKVALFIAKKKAVDLAGRYLSRKSLIRVYELDKDEIYSLAAREAEAKILEEKNQTVGKISTYYVRIRAWVQASAFIKAEMQDTKQEKAEAMESYRKEMEQHVPAELDPGKDIAKAYRLLREKKWRLAVIYLNHLREKYPNWGEIPMIKAFIFYIYHEPVFMKRSLNEACRLGHQLACDDLKHLKSVHKHDFGLSIIE